MKVMSVIVLLALAASPCAARPSDAELHALILNVHEKQENVGLAAEVMRDGKIVYRDTLGLADLENEVPVTAASRFGIASLTKLFTAVTLLQLVAEGRIDLDAPVQKYLPSFPKKSKTDITIRMLATHRSGIPHPTNRTPKLFATHYDRAVDAVEVFENDSLLFEPGTDQRYSSSNYNLIAAVIERVEGKPFTEVVTERIMRPLDLEHTSFDDILRPLPHRVRRYSYYQPWTYRESDTLFVVPTWDYSFNAGGGNINSTVDDVARFGTALCAPGLLPRAEWDVLWSEDWFGSGPADGRYIYATGANPGLQAGIAIYVETKTVGVVLSNTWGKGSRSGEMAKLAMDLADAAGGAGAEVSRAGR